MAYPTLNTVGKRPLGVVMLHDLLRSPNIKSKLGLNGMSFFNQPHNDRSGPLVII